MRLAFCENGDCRVVLYQVEAEEHSNCPGCGRFGAIKDEPSELEVPDE